MKQIRYIYMLLTTLLVFTACETYGDYDIEYTPIAPLGGQYRIHVYNEAGDEVAKDYCYIANTAAYDKDKCWIRIGSYNASANNAWGINGKINCDVKSLTFQGDGIENLAGNVAASEETFTVTNGALVLEGVTTPSGTVADKLSFTFTNSRYPNQTFRAEGYRYTGWNGD